MTVDAKKLSLTQKYSLFAGLFDVIMGFACSQGKFEIVVEVSRQLTGASNVKRVHVPFSFFPSVVFELTFGSVFHKNGNSFWYLFIKRRTRSLINVS